MPRRSRGHWNQDQDITGSDRSELIFTGRGDDTINAGGGNDIVFSGSGDDVVDGGAGRDYVNAGRGNDTLIFTMEDLSNACWGGHGRGHGHGGQGRGHHYGPRYDIYDGGRGFDTLVINLTAEQFANPDLVAELSAYLFAIEAGGRSFGYTLLSELGLAVRSVEALKIMVDGVLTDPRDPNPVDDVIAVDDSFAVGEDGQVTGSVAGNDTAPSGAVFTLLTLPSAGVLTFDADGGISFDAAGAFDSLAEGASTDVTFTYEISAGGVTSSATATITVSGTNDAPTVAAALSASAAEDDASFTVDLLDGAADVDDLATLSVTNVSALPAGVTLTGTTLTVDPADASFQHLNVGDSEVITVTYDVTDEHGATAAQTATITINGTNDAPTVAAALSAAAAEDDASFTVDLLDGAADVDDLATLSVTNVSALPAGVTLTGTTLSVDPADASFQHLNVGDSEVITVAFDVTDEHGATAAQTATITINGTNDAPTVAAALSAAAAEDDASFTVDLLDGAADVDDLATLSVTNVSALPAGVTLTGTTLSVDPADASFQHLNVGDSEVITVTFDVTDEHGATAAQTATITINGTNDAPTATATMTNGTFEGYPGLVINLLTGANDVDDGASLSVINVDPLPDGLTLVGSTLVLDPSDPSFEHLNVGDTAEFNISFEITDEHGATTPRTSTVRVTGTNDAPTVSAITDTTDEDSAWAVDLLDHASDIDDGAVLTFSSATQTSGRSAGIVLMGNFLNIDPTAFQDMDEGDSEQLTVTYLVTDENGASVTNTVTLTVTGTNDTPVVTYPLAAMADEDYGVFTLDLLDGASDVDASAVLSVTNVSALPAGVTLTGATLSVDPSDASFQHLNIGDSEVITVTYDVTDEHGATAAQTATITINGTNDAPVVSSAPSFTTNEDEASITADLLQNASDVDDGATLSAANVVQTGGALAPFTVSGNEITVDPSNFQYLALGESVSMSFAYDVVDEHGASVSTTADVVIEGRNDDPFVISTLPLQLAETGVLFTLATGAAVFDDVDTSDTHTYSATLVGGGALPAWLTIDPATGTLSGNPTEDIGLYHIELTTTDPHGASATTTFWLIENGNYLTGTSGPDELAGSNVANVLIGEGGNDGLYGGENSDIYVVRKDDGLDVVAEVGYFDTDIIFVDGVNAADAVFTRVHPTSDDYIISAGGQDIVLVRGSLNGNAYNEIEQVVFSDGTVMSPQDVREALFASEQTATGEFVWGSTRPDVIGGTAGDDFLQGNDGSDGYFFGMGDGKDTIADRGFADTDVVTFTDYSSTDAVFSRLPGEESTLVIDLPNGDRVTIINTLNLNSNDQIEQLRFDGDNVTLTMGDVREIIVAQDSTAGNDRIIGFFGDEDVITGGAGDDFIKGRDRSDTYVFGMGDGADTILDDGFVDTDKVQFTDYSFADATFIRAADSMDDLIISFANGDQVTVRSTLSNNSAHTVEQFEFLGSGSSELYTIDDVRQLILDAETLNPTNGELIGFDNRSDTLVNSLGVTAMAGGLSGDTYVMGTFFHSVVIKDKGYGSGDVLDLSDYTMADATFREREGDSNSFVLTLAGGGEILLLDQHTSADRIETYVFSDGTMIYDDVNALAALAAPVGDVFTGTSAGDTLAANGGHDHLFGLGGSDTYNFTSGNGIVEIEDNGAGSSDLLYFTDYNFADANFAVVEGNRSDLLIWFAGGDQVLVRNALLASHGDDIENYWFADGTIISAADMRQMMTDAYTTAGDDVIRGFAGSQTLNGGAGDDVMIGGGGSDDYVYNAGDGADVIRDLGAGGSDTLTINGYDLADATVSFTPESGDIKLVFGGGDQLVIRNSLEASFANTIETVTFSGAGVQVMTMADFRAIAIAQQVSAGDDEVYGTSQADVIEAGLGDDGIVGGDGGDTYVYTLGDGHDVIQDNGGGDTDTLLINGVLSTDVVFGRGAENGATLTITFADGGTVTILETLNGSFGDAVENITFAADGVTMTMKDVRDALIADQTTAGDDAIFGFNVGSGETLEGGAGDDYLSGRDGSDTYIFNIGDGDDVVYEDGAYDNDTFVFVGRNIADATFSVLAPGDGDLMIDFANGDSVWVIGGENGNYQERIETFQFDDGALSYFDVIALI